MTVIGNSTSNENWPSIKFRTQIPITLSTQTTKSYGTHEAVKTSKDDLYRLLVHGAEDIVCVDGDNETPVTLENYESLYQDNGGSTTPQPDQKEPESGNSDAE